MNTHLLPPLPNLGHCNYLHLSCPVLNASNIVEKTCDPKPKYSGNNRLTILGAIQLGEGLNPPLSVMVTYLSQCQALVGLYSRETALFCLGQESLS